MIEDGTNETRICGKEGGHCSGLDGLEFRGDTRLQQKDRVRGAGVEGELLVYMANKIIRYGVNSFLKKFSRVLIKSDFK